MHNIICLEAEWKYNSLVKSQQFDLKTEPLLHWLKEFYACDVVYRHILSKDDLVYYLSYIQNHKREFKNHDIIYIACHGWNHSISLEGDDGDIDLQELAELVPGVFEDRIVHFGCCKTLSNIEAAQAFKDSCGARLVSGYAVSVDAMKSAIADIALFNDLMQCENVGIIKNQERSKFRKTYDSLLEELHFVAV